MLIGKILKYIRIFNQYNQVELSQQLDVSRSYISELESCKKTPSIDILQKYSSLFDIPVSNILLFAENYSNKNSFRDKSKLFLANKAIKFLDWVSKEKKG